MNPILTTITPYWNRPEMLKTWMAAVKGAGHPQVKHIICFVGERVPGWVKKEYEYEPSFLFLEFPDDVPGELSIGHYHNRGARMACSEWMMKLDVDALPNVFYFKSLLEILQHADPNEWFNGGMIYVNEQASAELLNANRMPVSDVTYRTVMGNLRRYCGSTCLGPAATNFICRTQAYLEIGGCDDRFRGYGWEDYQQIFALERRWVGRNPLPGPITFENVTKRCCREISRRRARELWKRNPWLCLLHHFHQASPDRNYKSHEIMQRNKLVLLEYINTHV